MSLSVYQRVDVEEHGSSYENDDYSGTCPQTVKICWSTDLVDWYRILVLSKSRFLQPIVDVMLYQSSREYH